MIFEGEAVTSHCYIDIITRTRNYAEQTYFLEWAMC